MLSGVNPKHVTPAHQDGGQARVLAGGHRVAGPAKNGDERRSFRNRHPRGPMTSNAVADISGEVKRRLLTGLNGGAARRDLDER